MATALTDDQMKLVTAAAQPLAVEERDVFLWRVLGYLELRLDSEKTDSEFRNFKGGPDRIVNEDRL